MAHYAYKAACYDIDRIKYQELVNRFEEEEGREHDGDSNYDGDNWYIMAMWINELRAKVAELESQASSASVPGGMELSAPTILPDGSGVGILSLPLPKGHWLYAEREYEEGALDPKDLPAPILTHLLRQQVVDAIRYAVRSATNCGKEDDFDPDALVQNAVYALCGPYGAAAPTPPVSEDRWQPIETAPKDKFVLLAGPSGYTTIEIVYATGRMCSDYHVGRWIDHANDDLTDWGFEPTHWMPLPKSPAMQEDKS